MRRSDGRYQTVVAWEHGHCEARGCSRLLVSRGSKRRRKASCCWCGTRVVVGHSSGSVRSRRSKRAVNGCGCHRRATVRSRRCSGRIVIRSRAARWVVRAVGGRYTRRRTDSRNSGRRRLVHPDNPSKPRGQLFENPGTYGRVVCCPVTPEACVLQTSLKPQFARKPADGSISAAPSL